MTLTGFFFLCLLAGLIYAIISLILSGGFGATAGTDVHPGDAGVEHGGVAGEVTFSPLSPTVIATFITAFGAGGVVGTAGLRWSAAPSLGLALGSGLAIGYLVFAVLRAVYARTQGSSEAHAGAVIGLTAEVLSPITEDGMGEVAYVCRGTRYTGSARSASGTRIEKRSLVKIVKVVGSTLFVETDSGDQKSAGA